MFWIHGNYYDSRKAWKFILSKVGDCNVENLDCGSNSDKNSSFKDAQASDVILSLKTRDMFDSRPRVIRMRGLPPDYTLIVDYLKYVNNSNVLVVDSPVGYQDRKFISAATSNFYKTIASEGRVFDCGIDAKSSDDAESWVYKVFEDQGRKIQEDACSLLVSMKGRNYDRLYAEINQLLDYQTKKTISIEDVQACSVPLHTKTAWDLIDSLDMCDLSECLFHLESFYQSVSAQSGKSIRSEAEMLMGALHYHYLFMVFAKDASGEYFNYEGICSKIAGYKKEDSEGKREADYFGKQNVMMKSRSDSFKKALKNNNKQKVYGSYLAVCRSLNRIRFSSSDEVTKLCLNAFCMYVCNTLSEAQMLTLIGYSEREIKEKLQSV